MYAGCSPAPSPAAPCRPPGVRACKPPSVFGLKIGLANFLFNDIKQLRLEKKETLQLPTGSYPSCPPAAAEPRPPAGSRWWSRVRCARGTGSSRLHLDPRLPVAAPPWRPRHRPSCRRPNLPPALTPTSGGAADAAGAPRAAPPSTRVRGAKVGLGGELTSLFFLRA